MRPIVEIMTVNFSLLALDQIVNTAALLRHMSGGQFGVPLVIRMATGAGRQLAAQHSHSLEGWYAHVPGIRVLAPATVEDARGMLWPALHDPDPVVIFEHAQLYNMDGRAADSRVSGRHRPCRGAPRRQRRDADHLRRHACGRRCDAAQALAARRHLEPRSSTCACCARWTTATLLASVRKTRRALVVDEGWRSGSLAAEMLARIVERRVLRARRAAGAGVQRGGADPLCQAPGGRSAAAGAQDRRGGAADDGALSMIEFTLPSLGADMDEGKLVQWQVAPGQAVKKGDVVAVVDTTKAAVDVEIWFDGTVHQLLTEVGETVPVGAVMALLLAPGEAAPPPDAAPRPAAETGAAAGACCSGRARACGNANRGAHVAAACVTGGPAACAGTGRGPGAHRRQRHRSARSRARTSTRAAAGRAAPAPADARGRDAQGHRRGDEPLEARDSALLPERARADAPRARLAARAPTPTVPSPRGCCRPCCC